MSAGPVVDDDDAVSEAGTEGESAATTEEALLRAQQTQGEAMLVGQNSLNDSRKRLLEVQHSLQRSHEEPHGNIHLCLPFSMHLTCFNLAMDYCRG